MPSNNIVILRDNKYQNEGVLSVNSNKTCFNLPVAYKPIIETLKTEELWIRPCAVT